MVPIALFCGHLCSTIVIQTHVKQEDKSEMKSHRQRRFKNKCVTLGMKEERGSGLQSGNNEEQEEGENAKKKALSVGYCRPIAITDPCLPRFSPPISDLDCVLAEVVGI